MQMDILLLHGPPAGYLDETSSGDAVGCAMLRQVLEEQWELQPQLVVFGHIHNSYGQLLSSCGCTRFVNAAMFSDRGPPIVVQVQ